MKTEKQIQEQILSLMQKLRDGVFFGKGYTTYSEYRQDQSYVKALEWVIGDRKTLSGVTKK